MSEKETEAGGVGGGGGPDDESQRGERGHLLKSED